MELVRHQPAIICSDNRSYPALSLVALMNGTGETGLVLQRGAGPLDAPWMLSGRSQAFPAIPLDENGDIRIPWKTASSQLHQLVRRRRARRPRAGWPVEWRVGAGGQQRFRTP
jgi:hypothetical protein